MFGKREKTGPVDVSQLTPYQLKHEKKGDQDYYFLIGPNGQVFRGSGEVYISNGNGNGKSQVYLTWEAGVPIRASSKDSKIFEPISRLDTIYV